MVSERYSWRNGESFTIYPKPYIEKLTDIVSGKLKQTLLVPKLPPVVVLMR